jgi:murein DD-endopeptidase MepM/ murein hydrolase activator NlpD
MGGIFDSQQLDNQELDGQEVSALVAKAQDAGAGEAADTGQPSIRLGFPVDGGGGFLPRAATRKALLEPNTTLVTKATAEVDDTTEDLEQREQRVVRAGRGDTLTSILTKMGAERDQAKEMIDAASGLFKDNALAPGYEVHVTLVPSLTNANRKEPVRFTVFGEGHQHKVTVNRSSSGEFEPSATPIADQSINASSGDTEQTRSSSVYASLYNAGLLQGMQSDSIMSVLRIHAYETDFRRRIRPSDQVEYFFDVKDDAGIESVPGELLFTSISLGGEPQRYWRFRTPDGLVGVRLVSGFGMRKHPLLHIHRMHAGVDWAAPIGTPILAAGNGVIEEKKYKGDYGIYARIQHANGYHTAYAHMQRYGPGIEVGAKVRQGQVIGYIGMTGLTQGPHVHYEVLVNSRPVDPTQLQLPRERRLEGKQLADFQKERGRVDDLMRRPPVMTQNRQ